MIDNVIRDLLQANLGQLRETPNGWKSRNCPMCVQRGHRPDKRSRFGIKYPPEGGVKANCFNCGFLASWKPGWELPKPLSELLVAIGVSQIDVDRIKFQVYKENNGVVVEETGEIVVERPVTEKWVPSELPDDAMPLSQWAKHKCSDKDFLNALEYAYSRGIRDFDNVYWCPSKAKQYNRRIIFPFKYKGKIVGHTARYVGNPASKMIPKYLNFMPEAYLYNLDPQNDYKRDTIIVCEGMMDAYFTDGIGTLHDTINEAQIKMINNLGKKVILCPDRDKDGANLIKIALEHGWYVSFPNWADDVKDAGDAVKRYGRVLTIESILTSATNNPIQININRKFDEKKWSSNG